MGEREEEGGTFFNQAFWVQKLQTIQQKRLQRTVLRMVLTSNKKHRKEDSMFSSNNPDADRGSWKVGPGNPSVQRTASYHMFEGPDGGNS